MYEIEKDNPFVKNFISETSYIDRKRNHFNYSKANFIHGSIEKDSVSFVCDKKKIILPMPPVFFHYILDFLGQILYGIETFGRGAKIIIDISDININKNGYYGFVFRLLDLLKVEYEIISGNEIRYVNINNFVAVNFSNLNVTVPILYKNLSRYAKNRKDRVPHKKVFVSRKDYNSRIDDEHSLEQTFLNLGFEVVYPENFKSLQEQIDYFYDVKVIAGITGSGLLNSIFMQPCQTVIELVTILEIPSTINRVSFIKGEIHDYYRLISIFKKHKIISVPNLEKSQDEIKKYLTTDFT